MTAGLYDLPPGWRWVQLRSVCVPTERRNPTKIPDIEFDYVDISSVDNVLGQIVSSRRLVGSEAPSRARKVIRAADVLFATTRPYLRNIALVPPELDGQIASTGFCVIRANTQVANPYYLYYVCRSDCIIRQLDLNRTRGASYPAVTDDDVYDALIPLPPLDEQRRIVAKIEALMERLREVRRLRAEARADTDRLLQAALADVFPRPGADLPPGWRWVRLGDIFEIQQGASMSPRRRQAISTLPFLRARNIQWGMILLEHVDQMAFSDEEVEKLRLQPGDLLVCEGGEVGRTAIWRGELSLCLYQNHIHRLRLCGEGVPEFYMYWMMAAYRVFNAYTGRESRTAIPNLSRGRLSTFVVPFPPVDEQRRIVSYLNQVHEHMRTVAGVQERSEAQLRQLEQAILDRAFRGEL
ncbi:MAG: restriction endonuclease subunit S [Thermorudis peleae]|nr:restriction endonuclease subunit S [Thermorudis peleae]